ncbi:MAG TPA: 50S ribosomal protein L17 [Candidatus Saccharimonadales bacterium]|nr:50S ribosomal protein L17 [Candidatus Saccharimonadales bacterium]
MSSSNTKIAKFGRRRDQRRALLRSLAESLIINESIQTSLPKAKAAVIYTEKLITKAKKSKESLHDRRQVIKKLNTLEAANKLVDSIAPKLSHRNSGYFRIEKGAFRKGDGTSTVKVSFVDDLQSPAKQTHVQESKKADVADDKKTKSSSQQTVIKDSSRAVQPRNKVQAPRRTGVRGNR